MIFKQYLVGEDGNFHLEMPTRYVSGSKNYLNEADNFFREIGLDYFPVLEVQESDQLQNGLELCLRHMFLRQQVEYFISRQWRVRVVDVDSCPKRSYDFFGSGSENDTTALIMRALNAVRRNFKVNGFSARCLYITLTKNFDYADVLVGN